MLQIPRTPKDVRLHLSNYLSSGAYSDLEIRCNETRYAVHRIVLCSQVKFFENACNGEFEEAKDRIVDLSHEDPTAVQSMIQFAYTGDYSLDDGTENEMLQHVAVYAFSSEYDFSSLGDLAKEKSKVILEVHWSAPWIPEIVLEIYDSTHSSERGLRDLFVDFVVQHHEAITGMDRDAPFQRALEDVGDFSRDCFSSMSAKHLAAMTEVSSERPGWYFCRRCLNVIRGHCMCAV
ncbi:hypothetical protein BU16DRAFT_228555 [Lophium mytilinum]|uniref:BTB domain-containing protein n=1 Tax=Lophium mytilinum TaxID=390894 RepID=A0A6A6Q867_9PEZI|nr:hypothetical protein BU16DRAFT_228555 [Lophium mytilinum]